MRRWMIVLAIAGLFVALVAAPGAAKKDSLKDMPVLEGSGETTFGAVEVWTGDPAGDWIRHPISHELVPGPIKGIAGWYALMDPEHNRCDVSEATLEWTGKTTAVLETWEVNCPLFPPRHHTRIAHITPGGAVTLSGDPNPAYPPDDEGNHWLVKRSGCELNGTFPVYHGTYDFESRHLYAETHFHGICDGGTAWGYMFGIGKEDGPLHATFTIDITFDK